jgi:hypothetical protein
MLSARSGSRRNFKVEGAGAADIGGVGKSEPLVTLVVTL